MGAIKEKYGIPRDETNMMMTSLLESRRSSAFWECQPASSSAFGAAAANPNLVFDPTKRNDSTTQRPNDPSQGLGLGGLWFVNRLTYQRRQAHFKG